MDIPLYVAGRAYMYMYVEIHVLYCQWLTSYNWRNHLYAPNSSYKLWHMIKHGKSTQNTIVCVFIISFYYLVW